MALQHACLGGERQCNRAMAAPNEIGNEKETRGIRLRMEWKPRRGRQAKVWV